MPHRTAIQDHLSHFAVVIRRAAAADQPSLARLAALDAAPPEPPGTLPALGPVAPEPARGPIDGMVGAGDVGGGARVRGVLELLATRPEPLHWISGNAGREAVAAGDGAPTADDEPGRAA